jgi:peptidoglycan/LPS O-acetylase OafA/YrhL
VITVSYIVYSQTGYFEHTTIKSGGLYYFGSLIFIRGFFADFYSAFVPHSWSLTVEECFYVLCPVIFLFIKRNSKAIVWLPLIFIAAGCLIVFACNGSAIYGFFHDYRFLFNFTFFGRCIEFFIGIGVGLLYKKNRLPPVKKINFTITGIVVMMLCVFGLSLLHTNEHYGDYYAVGIVLNNLILPLAGISVLYWGLLTEQNIITTILSSKLFTLLGKSSYAFYLIHLGLFAELFYFNVSKNPALYFIYLNVLAIALYQFFEHPLNQFLKNKWRR